MPYNNNYYLFNDAINTFLINCYIGVGIIFIEKNPEWLTDRDRSQINRLCYKEWPCHVDTPETPDDLMGE